MKRFCDQCEALNINGLNCHETGCPNQNKVQTEHGWVSKYTCRECGDEMLRFEICPCQCDEERN